MQLYHRIKNNPFLKSILTLSLGSIVGQIISFIFLPLLSRLYTPQEYGFFSAFAGVCQIIILLSTLKYEKAILLPKKGDTLVLLVFIIVTTYALLITIILFILDLINFNFKDSTSYVYIIPIAIIGFGYLSIIINWCQREERYHLISKLGVIQTILFIGFSFLLGFYKFTLNGLIIGWVGASFFLSVGFVIVNRLKFYDLLLLYRKEELIANFLKYINFPKYYLLYDILSSSTTFLTPIIITFYFSQYECGLFSMAYRILMIPFIIISTSISNVFIMNANKLYTTNNNFNDLYKKTFKKILFVGIFIYLTSFLIGGHLIIALLGTKWKDIDVFIKIMSFWMFFEFIVTVFKSNTYVIVQRQKIGLIIQILNTIISLSCLILFSRQGIEFALIAFAISNAFFSISNLRITYKFSKGKYLKLL